MSFFILQIFVDSNCSQSDTLIYSDPIAYDGRLAYHDTNAMVDAEVAADLGPWVDIDSSMFQGAEWYNSRNQINLLTVQLVSQTVKGQSVETWVSSQNLHQWASGWIAHEHCFKILLQDIVNSFKLLKECFHQLPYSWLSFCANVYTAEELEKSFFLFFYFFNHSFLGQQKVIRISWE